MASSINKYAQNVARARYQTQGGTHSIPVSGRHAPTIDPSLFSGKSAKKPPTGESGSGGLASRIVEGLSSGGKGGGGESLPAQEYDPVTDAESGEDPNVPRGATVETQQPITQRGVDPRFMIQGNGPRIDLSGFFPERANTSYDPSKAIGGENVPYKPAGFFRSFLGDPANRKNIESQQAQGAKWEAEAAGEKERKNRREDLDYEIAARNKESARQFDIEQKRLADKAIQDEIKGYEDEAVKLAREGNEAVLKDADMVRSEKAAADKLALEERRVAAVEASVKKPRYQSIGDGLFQTPEGELAVFQPEIMGLSKAMPGRPARFRMLTGEGSKPPARSMGDEEVDRITGETKPKLGGPLPLGPENQNTALIPRFMRGAGDVMGGVMTSATDPLRYAGTDIYKSLFSSGAQQDPEVLKRLKKREEESSPWDIQ
jgi:hypothetical protein